MMTARVYEVMKTMTMIRGENDTAEWKAGADEDGFDIRAGAILVYDREVVMNGSHREGEPLYCYDYIRAKKVHKDGWVEKCVGGLELFIEDIEGLLDEGIIKVLVIGDEDE